jgi:hypothetical protein
MAASIISIAIRGRGVAEPSCSQRDVCASYGAVTDPLAVYHYCGFQAPLFGGASVGVHWTRFSSMEYRCIRSSKVEAWRTD